MRPQRNRKDPRLKGHDYSQQGYYYVTICTHNRKELFGRIKNGRMFLNEYGEIAKKTWLEIPNHFTDIAIDEFTIMPNHIHGILIIDHDEDDHADNNINVGGAVGGADLRPLRQNTSLSIVIHGFKSSTTRIINAAHITINPIWQRNYYDHIIRDERSLHKIREYIRNNAFTWDCDRGRRSNKSVMHC